MDDRNQVDHINMPPSLRLLATLPPAEQALLIALWSREPRTLRDILESEPRFNGMKESTVLAYARRLHDRVITQTHGKLYVTIGKTVVHGRFLELVGST